MNSTLKKTIESLAAYKPEAARASILNELSAWLKEKVRKSEPIRLNFICTHNSRRSHLGQIWAQTLAHHFGIAPFFSYSGGTQTTALFYQLTKTLETQGFKILHLSEGTNPVYGIKFSENEPAIICFSKKYDDPFNPKEGFAAVMTCSGADVGCPVVEGAEKRFPLTFEDPKASDGTPEMELTYFNRSLEIAAQLYYVMKLVADKSN